MMQRYNNFTYFCTHQNRITNENYKIHTRTGSRFALYVGLCAGLASRLRPPRGLQRHRPLLCSLPCAYRRSRSRACSLLRQYRHPPTGASSRFQSHPSWPVHRLRRTCPLRHQPLRPWRPLLSHISFQTRHFRQVSHRLSRFPFNTCSRLWPPSSRPRRPDILDRAPRLRLPAIPSRHTSSQQRHR